MPDPNVIAPSDSIETSSPLAPEAPTLHRRPPVRQSLGAMAVASSAPSGPITRRNVTGASGAMVREPSAMAVQWNGNRSPPRASTSPRPRVVVELDDRDPSTSGLHGTILEIGSSMIPLAPASSSAGISVLISLLATTVSTAKPSSPNSFDTVGDFSAGQQRDHAVEVGGVDVELQQHPAARLERAGEQRLQLLHRLALLGIGVGGGAGDQLGVRHEDGVEDAQTRGAQRAAGLGDLDDRVGDVGDLGLGGAVRQLARRRRRRAARSSAG